MTVTVDELLTKVVQRDGSDLHLKANQYPMVRIYGDLYPMQEYGKLTPEQVRDLCFSVISPTQRERFEKELELDFAYEVPGLSRFRGNIYQQRGHVQAAFRVIPYRIQTMEELHLPPVWPLLRRATAWTGVGDRSRWFWQVHHAGGDAALHQPELPSAYRYCGRPDRVRA